MKKVVETW